MSPENSDKITTKNLISINTILEQVFTNVLIPRGVMPKVSENPNFPFSDYDSTIREIKEGKAHLSFSIPSSHAFSVLSKTVESYLHLFLMMFYTVFAPMSLIVGTYITQNYYLLLLSILWFPLATFGTHPNYRSAPKFLFMCVLTVAYGAYAESASWLTTGIFLFFCIAGFSATRFYYNKIIIKRALTMEKALMFLLGSNALTLCDRDYSILWQPAWLTD